MGYRPWGRKESDTTKWLSPSLFILQGTRSKNKQISSTVGFWLNSSSGKTKKLEERENHFFLLLVESQGTIIEIGKHRHLAICWGSTSMRNQGISHSNSFSSSTLSTQQPRVCSVSMTRCYGSGSVQSSNINGLLQFQKLFSILASLVAFLVVVP